MQVIDLPVDWFLSDAEDSTTKHAKWWKKRVATKCRKRHLFVTVKSNWCCLLLNQTRTSKVGAISKAQKAQNFFFLEKNSFFSFEKCRIVPTKNVKGALLDLLTYILLQNNKKLEGGTLWGHYKIFEKKSHSAEKNRKRGIFSLVRFSRLR